jgi:type I restriction enzyme M protein
VQKEIVAEIEGYQKVIDGARAVLDNYRPHIPIHPDWPTKELGEVCRLGRGFAFKSEDYVERGVLNFRVSNIGPDRMPDLAQSKFLPTRFLNEYAEYQLAEGDFVIVMVGATTGKIGYVTKEILPALLNQNMWRFFPDERILTKRFLYFAVSQLPLLRQGAAREYLTQSDFLKNRIPLPPLETQRAIVAEIEAEQALVAANRDLIVRFEKKILATLARVWGEDEPAPAEA